MTLSVCIACGEGRSIVTQGVRQIVNACQKHGEACALHGGEVCLFRVLRGVRAHFLRRGILILVAAHAAFEALHGEGRQKQCQKPENQERDRKCDSVIFQRIHIRLQSVRYAFSIYKGVAIAVCIFIIPFFSPDCKGQVGFCAAALRKTAGKFRKSGCFFGKGLSFCRCFCYNKLGIL